MTWSKTRHDSLSKKLKDDKAKCTECDEPPLSNDVVDLMDAYDRVMLIFGDVRARMKPAEEDDPVSSKLAVQADMLLEEWDGRRR